MSAQPAAAAASSVSSSQPSYDPIGSVDRNQEATVYVANLEERITDDLLWELFTQVGPVVHVYIPKDRIAHVQSGYGFVEFQNEADAEYACRVMGGIKMFNKPLKVNKASQNRQMFDIGANLYVANLDASVDERILSDTFSVFGRVLQAKLGRDPDTGVPRGFAFINFDSFEAADAAIEAMNGQFLANRPISLSFAYKKNGKPGERHGTPAERLLAEQARKNSVSIGGPTNAMQAPSAVAAAMAVSAQAFLASGQPAFFPTLMVPGAPMYGDITGAAMYPNMGMYGAPHPHHMQPYPSQSAPPNHRSE